MKGLRILLIFTVLVIFPAISYLYLIKGFNFRMDALEQLEPKEKLVSFDYSELSLSDLKGKATIAFDGMNKNAAPFLEPIYNEFSHRIEFQLIGFVPDSSDVAKFKSTSQWKTVISDFPFDKDLALIDTSGTIRNYYTFDSISFKFLIQHIPIIIPLEKEKDIVLKRDNEK